MNNTLFFCVGDIITYDMGTRNYFGIVGESGVLLTAAYIEPHENLPRLHFDVHRIHHSTRNGRIVSLANKYERAMMLHDLFKIMRSGTLTEEQYAKCQEAIIYAIQYDKVVTDYDTPNPLVRIDIELMTNE